MLHDHMVKYYPYMEIFTADYRPTTAELLLFSEGLPFTALVGNDTIGRIVHNYYWEDTELAESVPQKHVSGTWIWTAVSDFRRQDSVKSASFLAEMSNRSGKNSIVEQLYSNYTFPAHPVPIISKAEKLKKMFLSRTNNYGLWYQANTTDAEFVDMMVKYAQTADQQGRNTSPFFSFINTLGEFYFMDIWSMLQQPTTATYSIYELEGFKSGTMAHNYQVIFTGSKTNMINYNKNFYLVDPKGNYQSASRTIAAQNISYGKKPSGHPIFKRDTGNIRDDILLGVVNETQDSQAYSGAINNEFIATHSSYRMRMTVPFNPKLAAGKLIELEIPSGYTDDKVDVPELSGKWIVMQSQQILPLNDSATEFYTFIEVFKPSIHIWDKNVKYKDYIKG
jgi:hypothetical protein